MYATLSSNGRGEGAWSSINGDWRTHNDRAACVAGVLITWHFELDFVLFKFINKTTERPSGNISTLDTIVY